jgi:hypothetical protein
MLHIGRIESIFEPHFLGFMIFLFDTYFSNADRGQMEMNFKKMRGFFSKKYDIQKHPPYFTQISHSGGIEDLLGPYFSEFREAKIQKDRWQRDWIQRHKSPTDPIKTVLYI